VDGTDAQRLWAALCQGAEIQMPLPPGAAEDRMRELGRILRSAVDGTLRLMAVRASTKHELRADVTVIQARGNNPLKFSPDAKSGLEYLLQPAMRGFLEGSAAMDDAMQDLVGHSIGTVAGMRAAIGGMLDRFGPEQLEAKLSGKSVLDSVLPINRKAKLWDLYLQHHDAIREEAQEDFHNLFGKAFLAAYEQQVAQLRRNNKSP
jgi:FHA domain-containing protein